MTPTWGLKHSSLYMYGYSCYTAQSFVINPQDLQQFMTTPIIFSIGCLLQCSKIRLYSVHTPGACPTKSMHSSLFLWVHFYINILISCENHAPAGCTCSKTYAPGNQNVHTGCRVHPLFRTLLLVWGTGIYMFDTCMI